MPLYAFRCETCGPFEEWRPLCEYSKPAQCPRCQAGARRVVTPPNLVRTPPEIRKVRALEEKSAHEPEVVRGPLPGRPFSRPHRHHSPPRTVSH